MFFKMLRRWFTGEVLSVAEVLLSDGKVTFRLKLKRDKRSGDLYVILSMSSLGESNHQYLDAEDLGYLAAAVQATQAALVEAQQQASSS